MMAGGHEDYGAVVRQVGRLLAGGSAVAMGEDRLLARYVADRDEGAFEALVGRHGPMVLATCRRILADPGDVEDAFQATFLVLARRAASIRDADRLGPWLHGVARRVAGRARALAARRNAVERPGGEDRAVAPADASDAIELRSALDEELARLPEKYRAPLVLCYLEGLTHDEAARHLRWPVGTVRSRLAGGRDRLRSRLSRRGLAPTSAALPATLPVAAISPTLLTTTARLAATTGTVPVRVSILAKGVLMAMTASKLKAIAAVGLMAGLAAGGVGAIAQQAGDGLGKAPAEAAAKERSPILDIRKEIDELDTEENAILRKLEQIQFDQAKARRPLEARIAELTTRKAAVEKRWGEMAARAGPAPRPDSDDLTRLQGEWTVLEMRVSEKGEPVPAVDLTWSIRGNLLVSFSLGQEPGRSTITLGTSADGPTIDLVQTVSRGGESIQRGLYRLDGDTLVVRLNAPGELRPAGFEVGLPGPRVLLTFRRVMPGGRVLSASAGGTVPGALEAANRRIKQLEDELKAARAELAPAAPAEARPARAAAPAEKTASAMGGPAMGMAPTVAPALGFAGMGTPMGAGPAKGMGMRPGVDGVPGVMVTPTGTFKPSDGQPTVLNLPGSSSVLVIPSERDRATLLNTETGARTTFRAPEGATELVATFTQNVGAIGLKGPGIKRVAAFDTQAGEWYPLDLREPAQGFASPVVGPAWAGYSIGRFVYVFSLQSKKWATLELKQEPPADKSAEMGGGSSPARTWNLHLANGKMIVPDGDFIHIYTATTGDWTHLDTKEKEGK